MTKPPYNPPGQGPTLLYIFQSYLPEGGGAPEAVAEREAAAARLTLEYEDGKIECPGLKPGARLEPKEGLRLPRLVTVVSVEDGITTRIKVPSETEFYYGPPRLDVVDVDGTRTPPRIFTAACASRYLLRRRHTYRRGRPLSRLHLKFCNSWRRPSPPSWRRRNRHLRGRDRLQRQRGRSSKRNRKPRRTAICRRSLPRSAGPGQDIRIGERLPNAGGP
jgi:hypothetical protein